MTNANGSSVCRVESGCGNVRIVSEEQHDQVAGEGEHRRLLRRLAVGDIVLRRSLREDEARQSGEQELSAKLLLDAANGLGMKLPKREVVGLLQLEELLDFPAHVVDLADGRAREFVAAQAGQDDPRFLPAVGDPNESRLELPRDASSAGSTENDAVVVPTTLLKHVDGGEGVALRHADDEVDARGDESFDHLVRRVAAIEHEDVPWCQVWQQTEQLGTLVGSTWRDLRRDGHLRDDVEQRAHERLRDVPAARLPEVSEELLAARQIAARPVDGEDPSSSPPLQLGVPCVELLADKLQEGIEQRRHQLPPSQAERCGANRLRHRQAHACEPCLSPELVKELRVTSAPGVTAHVKHQRNEQLRRERPTAREEAFAREMLLRPRFAEQAPQELLKGRREYEVTGFFQRPACQRLMISSLISKEMSRRGAGGHSSANGRRFQPSAPGSPAIRSLNGIEAEARAQPIKEAREELAQVRAELAEVDKVLRKMELPA